METVPENSKIRCYRLLVAGVLDRTLCDHFGGHMSATANGTLYQFPATDQTNLHGVLSHCRDYGTVILSLSVVEEEE